MADIEDQVDATRETIVMMINGISHAFAHVDIPADLWLVMLKVITDSMINTHMERMTDDDHRRRFLRLERLIKANLEISLQEVASSETL